MSSLVDFWKSIPSFAVEHWSTMIVIGAFVVSSYAAIISHISMRVTKRSAAATTSQAAAAKTSAEAASEQARHASQQSLIARDASEVGSLEAAKARIDQAAPSVVVVLYLMDNHPRVRRGRDNIPRPHPKLEPTTQGNLDSYEYRHGDIYFILRGTLYNDGDHAVRVFSHGPVIYTGKHPISGNDISTPQYSEVEYCHVLHSGQTALFEIHAIKQIDKILQQEKSRDSTNTIISQDKFYFTPGSTDEPSLQVMITTNAEPLRERPDGAGEAPVILKDLLEDQCHVEVLVKRTLRYPKSFEHLHAELLGDNEKLHALLVNDELHEAWRRNRNSG